MTPGALLQLWRDRWHLPPHPEHSVPLIHGRIARWTMDLARSNHWGLPGLKALVLGIVITAFCLAISTRLTTNSQIVLGWSLVAFAIYLRRHRGQVVALAIVCMAALLGLRYFFWRADATLPLFGVGSLLLSVALLITEFIVWFRAGLAYFSSVWPIETASAPLPEDPLTWPHVDVVLVPGSDSMEHTEAFVSKLAPLDWPRNKLRFVVISNRSDERLQKICSEKDVALLVYPECEPNDTPALLNRFLYDSDAELLVISDCSAPLSPDYLHNTVGWFVQEPRLSMIQAPGFRMAPQPLSTVHDHLQQALSVQPGQALLRRSSLLDIGGFSTLGSVNSQSTEAALDRAGYFNAYCLHHTATEHHSQHTRMDGPFNPWSLPLRVRLNALHQALLFYGPMTTAVFWLIPFSVLVLGATAMSTDATTLAAYWLPHWILGRLALATELEHHRLRWWDFVKEEMSSIAVLVRTGKSFVLTTVARLPWRQQQHQRSATNRLPLQVVTTPRSGVLAGIAAFATLTCWGILAQPWGTTQPPMTPLYIAWAAFLMLGFLAELAVQRELDWVQAHQHAGQHLVCMLKLSDDGRLVRATTRNFPQSPLKIGLMGAPGEITPQTAQLSLFLGTHEFTLPCKIVESRATHVFVEIDPQFRPELRYVSELAFSRPARWPMWLPPAHADRLLPGWMLRILLRLQDAFYNLTVKYTLTAVIQKVRVRIFPGSSTHG